MFRYCFCFWIQLHLLLMSRIVDDEHSAKVKNLMMDVLCPLITEADFVSNELLETILQVLFLSFCFYLLLLFLLLLLLLLLPPIPPELGGPNQSPTKERLQPRQGAGQKD